MKKLVILIACCGLSYAGFAQQAAPKMAASTPGKATQQPNTGKNKPVMGATAKSEDTQPVPATTNGKPVMANTALHEKPQKKYRFIGTPSF